MKPIPVILVALLVSLATAGCHKEEGPAERAGKELDKTVNTIEAKIREAASQAEKKFEETSDKIKKSMDSAGERAKKASDKMKQQDRESQGNDHEGGDN